jgi:hypothetical protein
MASTRLGVRSSNAVEGLGTNTYTVEVAAPHSIECKSFLLPPTGLSIVINKNGSPLITSTVVNSDAQLLSVETAAQFAIGDVITVVLSSSVPNDNVPNSIKSIIDISRF